MKKRKKLSWKKKLKRIWLLAAVCILTLEILALTHLEELKKLFQTDSPAIVSQSEPNTDIPEDKTISTKELVGSNAEGTVSKPMKREIRRYIFVGDSRYVAMSIYEETEDIFIAKNGMAYNYLVDQIPNIKRKATEDSVVIIGLGVNDAKYVDPEDYIETINELAEELPCPVCYMLVNPVDDKKIAAHGYSVRNSHINAFNRALKKGLSKDIVLIDTNSYLKSQGFKTEDGLHYDNDTYKLIYDYIKAMVQ